MGKNIFVSIPMDGQMRSVMIRRSKGTRIVNFYSHYSRWSYYDYNDDERKYDKEVWETDFLVNLEKGSSVASFFYELGGMIRETVVSWKGIETFKSTSENSTGAGAPLSKMRKGDKERIKSQLLYLRVKDAKDIAERLGFEYDLEEVVSYLRAKKDKSPEGDILLHVLCCGKIDRNGGFKQPSARYCIDKYNESGVCQEPTVIKEYIFSDRVEVNNLEFREYYEKGNDYSLGYI